jgi:hypothetical protein
LETFLAEQRSAEHEVQRFVEREFCAFLECGVLSLGFLRVHCGSFGMDRVVGFSCKKRGWCPSCGGRRMAEIRIERWSTGIAWGATIPV